jgi:hypothetical protein
MAQLPYNCRLRIESKAAQGAAKFMSVILTFWFLHIFPRLSSIESDAAPRLRATMLRRPVFA